MKLRSADELAPFGAGGEFEEVVGSPRASAQSISLATVHTASNTYPCRRRRAFAADQPPGHRRRAGHKSTVVHELKIEQELEDASDLEDGLVGYMPETRDESIFGDRLHLLTLCIAQSIET
jgi:hypothetical protein